MDLKTKTLFSFNGFQDPTLTFVFFFQKDGQTTMTRPVDDFCKKVTAKGFTN